MYITIMSFYLDRGNEDTPSKFRYIQVPDHYIVVSCLKLTEQNWAKSACFGFHIGTYAQYCSTVVPMIVTKSQD